MIPRCSTSMNSFTAGMHATGRDDHVEPGADAADPPPEEDDGQDPDDGPQDVHRDPEKKSNFAELLACILSGVLCKKESKFLSFGSTTSNSCKCTYRKVALFTVRQSTLSPIIPRRQRKVFWLCLFPTLSNNPLQKTNCHK